MVAQLGSMKAGVQLVNFSEASSKDALDHALKSTNAKGLIFSPNTPIDGENNRITALQRLIPELSSMYFGEELNSCAYPHLDRVI